jgi:N-acetylglucosamine kinase-like BadF-type ATPase
MSRGVVLGVDGGNSKTDLLLASRAGEPLARVRGGTTSHQAVALDAAMERFDRLLEALLRAGDAKRSDVTDASFCVAGADFPSDVRLLQRSFAAALPAARLAVENDAFGALRAGATRGWGVAVICGAGVNAAGVAPSGRRARLAAHGDISGDWGGGMDVGWAALAAAVRARDGRGPATALARIVPEHFGVRQPRALTGAFYREELDTHRLRELSPLVFDAARKGDQVAREIANRLAQEVATMALAIIGRLGLVRSDVEVVLAGGVMATTDRAFHAAVEDAIHERARRAQVRRLTEPPVLGATLLALDNASKHSAGAEERLRATWKDAPLRTVAG